MPSLLKNIPAGLSEEFIETLWKTDSVKIERIVSKGHASPPGFWYDQEEDEFVLVVRGSAGLRFEGREDIVVLDAGDYIGIKAHVRHRVEWTDPAGETVWLAVFSRRESRS
ncbi:MAG: cupin domain-containing protein [Thermodesulfobacteriota bacterium]|nr:cupin domain-containing protein [Thermodesulfobacteriota bacterium]